jgi:hypothetical protein
MYYKVDMMGKDWDGTNYPYYILTTAYDADEARETALEERYQSEKEDGDYVTDVTKMSEEEFMKITHGYSYWREGML